MEVLTIEHSAFQQLISKIDAMDEFIRKVKLEQQSSLDGDWVDGKAVCEYLCICDKTLQRLRSAGKSRTRKRHLETTHVSLELGV